MSAGDVHPFAATGFGRAADVYERGRPDYPPAIVNYLKDVVGIGRRSRILDLGAGTGKFTRLVSHTGAQVIALEPVLPMLAICREILPDTPAIAATAQDLPLKESSVQAVVVAQAFHWFCTTDVLKQLRRVLTDDGRLILIWNVRDQSVPWVAELTKIMDRHGDGVPRYRDGTWKAALAGSPYFGQLNRAIFENKQPLTPAVLKDRVCSVSYIASLPEKERRAVEADVDALMEREVPRDAQGNMAFPYQTEVYWATVRSKLPGRWGPGCRGDSGRHDSTCG
jgi:SAM-dependent methyltransferase